MSLRHVACALVGLAALTSPAGADSPVFRPTTARPHVSLDGRWRFNTADRPEFARPDLDDRSWSWITVPGDWTSQGWDHTGYAWYRLTFAFPKGSHPRYLRFDHILDRAEVWLNGVKLVNPGLSDQLAGYQVGAFWGPAGDLPCRYRHLWSFRWPLAFDVGEIVRPGKNVLAVRVCNDPTTSYWIFSRTPDPTNRGAAGILAPVYLICVPQALRIADIAHEHPRVVTPDGLAEHRFAVSIENDRRARRGQVALAIRRVADGRVIWRERRSVVIPEGASEISFQWATAPRFERYEAEVTLVADGAGGRDQCGITLVGTVIEARGRQLCVNGEPFLIKGANGFPGHYWRDGGIVDWALAERDLALMQSLGVNSIRGFQYPPQVIERATGYGITVNFGVFGPSCSSVAEMTADGFPPDHPAWIADAEIMALAARDYPNVLFWNTANEVTYSDEQRAAFAGFLDARRAALHRLDPVGRPCVYSNLGGQDMVAGQDVVAWNLYGVEPDDYAHHVGFASPKPAMLTEWGMFTSETDYDGTLSHLAVTWREGVLRLGWAGAYYYSGLEDYVDRHPGFRAGPDEVHDDFCAGIKALYSDVDAIAVGERIELRSRRPYALRDVTVTLAPGESPVLLGDIAPHGAARMMLPPEAVVPPEIGLAYTTHGGLACRYRTAVK